MEREKQIEEMAVAIEQARIKAADTTNSMNYGFGGWYAKELYNAGYRKADEVRADTVREFAERLKNTFDHRGLVGVDIIMKRIDQIAKEMLEGDNAGG